MKIYSIYCLTLLLLFTGFIGGCGTPNSTESSRKVKDSITVDTLAVPKTTPDVINTSPISISEPLTGSEVCWQEEIKIQTTVTAKMVIYVVHPTAVSGFWVQNPLSPYDGGIWKGVAHFGINKGQNIGDEFEVRAFINPKQSFKVGQELKDWPEADYSSSTISIKRKGC